MKTNTISIKLLIIAVIGGACFIASMLVFGLVEERESSFSEAKQEIAGKWGTSQVVVGPMLSFGIGQSASREVFETVHVLPTKLNYEVVLKPEVRSRGMYKTVVYTAFVKGSGEFSEEDIVNAGVLNNASPVFSLVIPDTRGIEKEIFVVWNGKNQPFQPGSDLAFQGSASGFHARVQQIAGTKDSFSFEFPLRGSESFLIAPVGKETTLKITSPWQTPKFIGAFLPQSSDISSDGFKAEWNISSFGRPYPQVWRSGEAEMQNAIASAAGVELYNQIDVYTNISRSIKYAILFIMVTFSAFFVFETLTKLRIHPIQYLLIGASLALFYLLLLSFAEHIGFLAAYGISTLMIAGLIAIYSARVLQNKRRASIIFGILLVLYGYLYYVLMLEDYALLFGSLLLFVLLAAIMYLTRNVNWFEQQ